MQKKWQLLFVVFFIVACASAKVVKKKHIEVRNPNEGTIYGKVEVLYNGKNYTENCTICFRAEEQSCYELDVTGLLVMNLKAGMAALEKISCKNLSMRHFDFTGSEFVVEPNARTYIGDLTFEWVSTGAAGSSLMYGLTNAAPKISGHGQWKVQNKRADADKLFQDIFQGDKTPARDSVIRKRRKK